MEASAVSPLPIQKFIKVTPLCIVPAYIPANLNADSGIH